MVSLGIPHHHYSIPFLPVIQKNYHKAQSPNVEDDVEDDSLTILIYQVSQKMSNIYHYMGSVFENVFLLTPEYTVLGGVYKNIYFNDTSLICLGTRILIFSSTLIY